MISGSSGSAGSADSGSSGNSVVSGSSSSAVSAILTVSSISSAVSSVGISVSSGKFSSAKTDEGRPVTQVCMTRMTERRCFRNLFIFIPPAYDLLLEMINYHECDSLYSYHNKLPGLYVHLRLIIHNSC
ncbi:MAG TPA: hypothetical protein DCG51_02840 [Erysipelotrichaceae bacterium]|nr:hypothetical protein [Erysipelotrichaceae bacterium]